LNGVASFVVSSNVLEDISLSVSNDAGLEDPSVKVVTLTEDAFVGKVSAGQNFSLYLNGQGELYGAGLNSSYGQLGFSDLLDRENPDFIVSDVKDISAGLTSSYFVKKDGSLWGMGRGFYGELGRGLTSDHSTPVQIISASVERVEAGKNYVLYLKSNGSLWAIGRNDFGQLGDGTMADQSSVQEIFDSGIIDFSAGSTHSLFLKNDGSAWSVGENNYGQLGDTTNNNTSTPIMVSGMSANVTAVSAGASHSVFLMNDGSLWTTGFNTYGQLGDTSNSSKSTPVMVVSGNVDKIYAGYQTTMFVKNDGSLWAMGQGVNGEFGNGNSTDSNVPVEILNSGVYQVDTNYQHSLFLMGDGVVKASGEEDNGELAVNYSGYRTVSSRIDTNFPQSNTETIVANSYSVSAINTTFNPSQGTVVTIKVLDSNGDVIVTENTLEFTLSVNANATIDNVAKGQGDGVYGGVSETVTARNGLVSIKLGDAIVETFELTISNNRAVSGQTVILFETDNNASNPKVEAGRTSSFYLTNTGGLYGSGQNDFGQLGDGTMNNYENPIQIYPSNILDVASGYYHTLFLKTDGSVWASGQNDYGQLGDGSNSQQTTPVEIFSGNVVKIWAGEYHSLFLMNNQELWGVGKNTEGQLGDATNTDRNSPVLISTGVIDAAAGQHTLFVKSDGSLWACGYNMYGALGDGSTTNQNIPMQVALDVVQCFAGLDFSFFIKNDGSLWGMGHGTSGQRCPQFDVIFESRWSLKLL
jgi:alpha-tubulin suppressor-like RCC1 family protein